MIKDFKRNSGWGQNYHSGRDGHVQGKVESRFNFGSKAGKPFQANFQFRAKCPVCGKMVTGSKASTHSLADMRFMESMEGHIGKHHPDKKGRV